jgi:hypothetical protein
MPQVSLAFYLQFYYLTTYVSFTESHTGAALANTVHRVLCRFNIENRVSLDFVAYLITNKSHRSGVLCATTPQTMLQ